MCLNLSTILKYYFEAYKKNKNNSKKGVKGNLH